MKKRGDLTNGLPPDEESGGGGYQPRPNDLDRTTELKLIDAALLGDMQAFSEVFEHYRTDLYGLCCRRLNDFSLAEDAVQDTFIRALKSFPNFYRNRPVWPWFVNIAYKACIDIQRRRSFTHYSGDIGVAADAEGNGQTESPLDSVIASEERAELWKSLEILPERQRRAFVLYEVDGLSCADIAAAEGISVAAVYRLLFRARKKIRSVHQSRPLPAIVFPFTWLGWKLKRLEERIRTLLGVYSEGLSTACMQAACVGTVAVAMVVAGLPAEALKRESATRSNETVRLSAPLGALDTASPRNALLRQLNTETSDKPPAAPQSPVAGPVNSLVDDVTNPNQNATPEEATELHSIMTSPNYENDHTILMAGRCLKCGSYVLFASYDGGASWKPLPSFLLSGSVATVVSPGYPQDRRIFAIGDLGLQQSDDGGGIFRTVTSSLLAWSLAISPAFGNGDSVLGGDSKLLIGGKTVLEYGVGTGIIKPAFSSILPSTEPYYVTYSPTYNHDRTIFVSHGVFRHNYYDRSHYRCKGSVCDEIQFPISGPLTFRLSPRFDQDGLAYAFTDNRLLVSHDATRTFRDIQFPTQNQRYGSIQDVAVFWNTSSYPVIFIYGNSNVSPVVYRSFDEGFSWTEAPVDIPQFRYGAVANKLIVTPTGRLLATGARSGVACSEDLGETWNPRCPPEQ